VKYILCYGDSNTRGASPDGEARFDFAERWPGILQHELGAAAHIYENGLGGRTTAFTDDVEPGRNGRLTLEPALDINRPLDLVIIMLGTNDCKKRFAHHSAWDVAEGMRLLIKIAKRPEWGPDGQRAPQVLVVAPPKLGSDRRTSALNPLFSKKSTRKSAELAGFYRQVAKEEGVCFLDASPLAQPGTDGVHLSRDAHASLGKALAAQVREILAL
jgi:lysophospholipase L1-like esterase